MKSKLYKKRILTSAAMFILLFIGVESNAQSLLNDVGGTIENSATGVIKFNNDNGEFQNEAAVNINNDGVIEFVGTDNLFTGSNPLGEDGTTWRVPGTVRYSRATGAQNVHGRYYNILDLTNGTGAQGLKRFPAETTYVFADYTAAGGDRDYATNTNTFVYDGDATSDQTILPEGGAIAGTNRYWNIVFMDAGVKTLNDNETAYVESETTLDATNTGGVIINGTLNCSTGSTVTQAAAAPIVVDGVGAQPASGQFYLGTGDADLDGNVEVNGGGLVTTEGGGTLLGGGTFNVNDGNLNINNGDATIDDGTLTLTANSGVLNVQEQRIMTVTGTFANLDATKTNMNFADNAGDNLLSSSVIYNGGGGQNIVSSVETHPYANLTIQGAAGKSADGDVWMAASFHLDDNDFVIGSGNTLVMNDETGLATYGSGLEMVGAMRRFFNATSNPLTYNNEQTVLTCTDNPANLIDLTLEILPNTVSEIPDFKAETDIRREIIYSYNSNGGATDWVTTLRAGFKSAERAAVNADSLAQLRFREITVPSVTSERIATGFVHNRTGVSDDPFGWLELRGIRPTGGAVDPVPLLSEVTTGNYIFMRGGPGEFISITSGRWSNPGTWDEGEEPPSNAIVTIAGGTQVHTGFRRDAADNYGTPEARSNALAQTVTIEDDAALIFGQIASQGGDSPVTDFAFSPGAILFNNGSSALGLGTATADLNALVTTAPGAYSARGYINYEGTTIKSNGLENTGSIHNSGTIEVGD